MTTTVHSLVVMCAKSSEMSKMSSLTLADILHNAGGDLAELSIGGYGAIICSMDYFNKYSGKPIGHDVSKMYMQVRMYEQKVVTKVINSEYEPYTPDDDQ